MKENFNIINYINDYAITEIKYNTLVGVSKYKCSDDLNKLKRKLIKSLGYIKFQQLLLSKDYYNLYEVNLLANKIQALYSREEINNRLLSAKRNLSAKFLLSDEISEIKPKVGRNKL